MNCIFLILCKGNNFYWLPRHCLTLLSAQFCCIPLSSVKHFLEGSEVAFNINLNLLKYFFKVLFRRASRSSWSELFCLTFKTWPFWGLYWMSFNLTKISSLSQNNFQSFMRSGNYLFYSFPVIILLWELFLPNFAGCFPFLYSLYSCFHWILWTEHAQIGNQSENQGPPMHTSVAANPLQTEAEEALSMFNGDGGRCRNVVSCSSHFPKPTHLS